MIEIKNFVMGETSIGGGLSRKHLDITIHTDTKDEMDNVRRRICSVLSENFDDTDSYGNTIKKG